MEKENRLRKRFGYAAVILAATIFCMGCEPEYLEDWLDILEPPDNGDTEDYYDSSGGWDVETDMDTDYPSTSCAAEEVRYITDAVGVCDTTVTFCFDAEGEISDLISSDGSRRSNGCLSSTTAPLLNTLFPCHADECITIVADSDVTTDTDWDDDVIII